MLRGLTPEEATVVMDRLNKGESVRSMVMPPMRLSLIRFRNHCAQNPEWAAEAERLRKANTKAMHHRRMEWKRSKTHCVHGHELSGHNILWKHGGTSRSCRRCNQERLKVSGSLTEDQIETIKKHLSRGVPLTKVQGSRKVGGIFYVAPANVIERYRDQDPELDRFVLQAVRDKDARTRFRVNAMAVLRRRQEAEDYANLRSMVPLNIPHRDDVVNSIYRAMLEGIVERDKVRETIQFFIRAEYKFVHNPWRDIGFDAPLRAGSEFKLADVISENKWD